MRGIAGTAHSFYDDRYRPSAVIEYRKFFVAKLTFIRAEFDQVCPI